MNTVQLIKKLENIKKAENFFYDLDTLIAELKTEVIETDTFKSKSTKQRTKKAISLLKSFNDKGKGSRPILNYADIQGDYMYFTNSYYAFKLKEHLDLPLWNDPVSVYPKLEKLFPAEEGVEIKDFDFDNYLNKLKVKELQNDTIYYYNSKDETEFFVDANFIKSVCDVLGTTDLEVTLHKTHTLKFVAPNGDEAIVLCKRGF